jgi:SAM-dependent methyltransferase
MSLVEEYRKQFAWRDWDRALSLCPLVPGQAVLDLGCAAGDVSGLLAARGLIVTGVDANAELLAAARERYPQCRFEQQDLRRLNISPSGFDGLWCSFTAAYFVDFARMWSRWAALLKPTAWVCVIDMDDLLGHEPLRAATRTKIEAFYEDAFAHGRYDFRSGRKLSSAVRARGFEVRECALRDNELAFLGPALPEVLQAWQARLARMGGFQQFLGSEYADIQTEFLHYLSSKNHSSQCRVLACVGTRGMLT